MLFLLSESKVWRLSFIKTENLIHDYKYFMRNINQRGIHFAKDFRIHDRYNLNQGLNTNLKKCKEIIICIETIVIIELTYEFLSKFYIEAIYVKYYKEIG